jgi:acetoin utilization protein AcuB
MKRIPPIKTVMTPFPHSVESTTPLNRAVEIMAGHEVRCLPVVDGGRVIGVVADLDARRALDEAATNPGSPPPLVQDVCDTGAYVVELTEPLDVVLLEMAKRHADPALVTKDGRLVGIFTKTDACRRFSQLLRSLFPRGPNDDAA